tara:strand:- start:2378 stop:3277 length:900 start_codon:yes stop_codon:yes gene_type:complete
MKKPLTIIILLISNFSFCQLKSVIIDSETKAGIPYVNIWVENENAGTTSNEKGEFSIDITSGKFLILSSLGYEKKRIEISSISERIVLNPKITELNEVTISSTKEQAETVIGKFNDLDVGYYYGSFDKPEIKARYFPFDSSYAETPYLKKIKFRIYSNIRNAKFNIRFYSIGENGEPKNPIYEKNIIAIVKKGTKNTELDLSELDIIFPEDGIFISYEWLIIPENEFKVSFPIKDSKKRVEKIMYEPKVGFLPSETDENSWTYKNGKWEKVKAFDEKSNSPERYINKFGLLAIEMTLMN